MITSVQVTPRLVEYENESLRLECVYTGHKNTVRGVAEDGGKLWSTSYDY